MKNRYFGFSLFILVTIFLYPQLVPAQKSYEFSNGQWFDGKKFKKQTFYSVNGLLTRKKPDRIDEVIDLQNGYVIPPFADAHTHNFDSNFNIDAQVGSYLRDGVFYAKVQTNVRSSAVKVTRVNQPDSVDASYAHGALTHSYGHGIEVYEALALGFFGDLKLYEAKIPQIAASRLRENDAYYIIDTKADLENKWQKILDGKPAFLKIYLLTSEEFAEKEKKIPNIPLGSIGIDPALVPLIVEKARKANLRVSAHVDTITDFRIALAAGVDEMAHLPGYYVGLDDNSEKYRLTAADAREAAAKKVWVVPAPVAYQGMEPKIREKTDRVLKHNLGLLKKAGARVAFGSDRYNSTPLDDVLYLNSLKIFSNLETLKIWCEETPQTIFPRRPIGFLRDDYEASFLVLKGNPLENFAEIKNISLRFKQGNKIEIRK